MKFLNIINILRTRPVLDLNPVRVATPDTTRHDHALTRIVVTVSAAPQSVESGGSSVNDSGRSAYAAL
jgi:hypothetical protein